MTELDHIDEIQEKENEESNATPQAEKKDPLAPILPDEEYAAEVAKEDPEELKQARSRLMTLIRIKARSLGNQVLTQQIQPMVESMSLSDCNNMYKEIKKRGMVGLSIMLAKHNKQVKKENGK